MSVKEQERMLEEIRESVKRTELIAYLGIILASAAVAFLAGFAVRSFLT